MTLIYMHYVNVKHVVRWSALTLQGISGSESSVDEPTQEINILMKEKQMANMNKQSLHTEPGYLYNTTNSYEPTS